MNLKIKIFIVSLILTQAAYQLKAQEYHPVSGKMMTEWGARVSPENVWQEYPRPQMKRDEWSNLNGLWQYAITSKEAGAPKGYDGDILVPFAVESSLSGVGKTVKPDQKVWYRTTFRTPAEWKGKNIILHFQAVDWETTVWLNGKVIGVHKGGSDPFSFDITPFLGGKTQELVLSVWDPTDTGMQARGKQTLNPRGIWYTAVTGIWQTVWLEPVSKTAIKSIVPVSDIDQKKIHFKTKLEGAKGNETLKFRITKDGNVIIEETRKWSEKISFDIPSPELWTPSNPALYQFEAELLKNGKKTDKISSYFAMRKISMNKDNQGFLRMELNNEPLFQYGALDQGWWPDGLLTPPSAEGMRYDMVMLKEMGFNMLRKHIKVEPALYYYYADSLGLLLWQDMVSGYDDSKRNVQHVSADAAVDWERPKESAVQFETELKAMIDYLEFFPSITTWVIFNEGWGQYDTKRVVEWAENYDTTRLINGVSGWADRQCGDMIDVHQYPGPGMASPEENPGRVVVLGEFGGLGLPIQGHLWNPEMRNWGYRTYSTKEELIKEYARLIYNLIPLIPKGLSAAIYTQTTDVEGEVNGLLSYDRKVVKIDPELLKIMNTPIYQQFSISDNGYRINEIEKVNTKISRKQVADWVGGNFSTDERMTCPVKVKKGESIWSTSEFFLEDIPSGISVKLLTRGYCKVYLNGRLVLDRLVNGFRQFEDYNISEFSGFLKEGRNQIAVEVADYNQDGLFNYDIYSF